MMFAVIRPYGAALTLSLVASLAVGSPWQNTPAPPPHPEQEIAALGPQVGQRALEFNLPDQDGLRHTLASLLRPNGMLLVFSRSADW